MHKITSKKNTGYSSSLVFFIFLLVGAPCALSRDTNDTNHRLQELSREIDTLNLVLQKIIKQRSQAQMRLRLGEQKMGDLYQNIRRLEMQIKNKTNILNQLHNKQKKLSMLRQNQQNNLAKVIKQSYIQGGNAWLKLLLNQQNPDFLLRNLTYYKYFYQAQNQRIESYNSTIKKLEKVESKIKDEQRLLKNKRANLKQQQIALNQERSCREKTLEKIKLDFKKKGQEIFELKAQHIELQNVFSVVTRFKLRENAKKHFSSAKGSLIWPTQGKLIKTFGSRSGGIMSNRGILISARMGSPVYAIYSGRVVFSDWLRGYGFILIVDHGGEYLSLYAHNQTLLKQVGNYVETGEIIARVGESGGIAHSALYFELRQKGRPDNPLNWLATRTDQNSKTI